MKMFLRYLLSAVLTLLCLRAAWAKKEAVTTEADLIRMMQTDQMQRVLKPTQTTLDGQEEGPPVAHKHLLNGSDLFADTNPKPAANAPKKTEKSKSSNASENRGAR